MDPGRRGRRPERSGRLRRPRPDPRAPPGTASRRSPSQRRSSRTAPASGWSGAALPGRPLAPLEQDAPPQVARQGGDGGLAADPSERFADRAGRPEPPGPERALPLGDEVAERRERPAGGGPPPEAQLGVAERGPRLGAGRLAAPDRRRPRREGPLSGAAGSGATSR